MHIDNSKLILTIGLYKLIEEVNFEHPFAGLNIQALLPQCSNCLCNVVMGSVVSGESLVGAIIEVLLPWAVLLVMSQNCIVGVLGISVV